MNVRRMKKKLVVATMAMALGATLGALPASADCVSAEASYKRPGQTKQYVVGPKRCVAPTPWNEGVILEVPAGEPSIVEVEAKVWVPLP